MTHFADRLAAAIKRCGNPVMVGLDPRFESLPASLRERCDSRNLPGVAEAYTLFCRDVIDVVAPLVPVVKPQAAFFEQLGPAGMSALADVIAYASGEGLLVVIDGKRNDIGTTATAYAEAYLGSSPPSAWGGDALTVSPYLGADSLEPFLELAMQRDAGIFVLVKTSNPGGGLFQDLKFDNGQALYHRVAGFVQQAAHRTCGACGYGAVGAVVGATYPQQLAELRQAMPNTWFLVPGYGAQGAGARDVRDAFAGDGLGAVVNNSRGIIFAYQRGEYAERFEASQWQRAVEAATRAMIDQLASETPAGQLIHRPL
ncbi:MAG: orotidine-5'-phosphate decarboxylase [Pirellulaceae bacterium]